MQNPSFPLCGQPYRCGSQKPCASCKNPVRENSLFLRRPPVFRIAAGGKTGNICADNAALYDFAQIILRGYDLRRTLLCQAFLCRALLCRAVLYRLLFLRHSFMPSDFMPSGFTSHNFVWHSFVRRAAPPHIGKGNVGEPLLPRRRACLPLPRMRPPV